MCCPNIGTTLNQTLFSANKKFQTTVIFKALVQRQSKPILFWNLSSTVAQRRANRHISQTNH